MAEFLASVLGVGVIAILVSLTRHYLRQREWEKRIKTIVDRYDLHLK